VNIIRWYHADNASFKQRLPMLLRPYLLDDDSLTRHLNRHCGQNITVTLRSQRWNKPLWTERQTLHLSAHHYARVRQVYLGCKNQTWVFARTVIPMTTLSGQYRYLGQLGTSPLGKVLFAEHALQRVDLQIAQLRPQQPLYQLACQNLMYKPDELWARRSIFRLKTKPLLVTEVFLPEFLSSLD